MKIIFLLLLILIRTQALAEAEEFHDFNTCFQDTDGIGWTDCDVSNLGDAGTVLYDEKDEYYNDACRDELAFIGHYTSPMKYEVDTCQYLDPK